MHLVPMSLTPEEIEDFYEGFSNATLWPLYHDVVAKPEFHREWWDAYVAVNQRFAEKAAEVAAKDATVWVHDYQLQLVPQMLRELRPDLRIGFYLHIPFPPAELFQQLPWRRQILEGLLGADLVGFQLPGGAARLRPPGPPAGRPQDPPRPGLPARRPHRARRRRSRSRSTPRGFEELARSEAVQKRAKEIREALGNPRKIFLGIDRLDYTKGIYARLRAFAELIARRPLRRRGRRLRPGRDAVARAGRAVPDPARRHRPPGRPDQRRPRPDRPPGDHLPALVLPPRGDGRALPRRRHHGRDAVPRRHEPRRQGVRRLPLRRRRRAGALGVRRRRRRAAAGLAGQPLRHQRHEGRAARGLPRRRPQSARAGCGRCARPITEHDVAAWARELPRRPRRRRHPRQARPARQRS